MTNQELNGKVTKVLEEFLREFVKDPYLCYTEHGLHALFFQRLYAGIDPPTFSFTPPTYGRSFEVCRIQKEYRTAEDLELTQRQHWDIAVIGDRENDANYDSLPLAAVVEFGLNARLDHLVDDILRVRHKDANTHKAYIVHLYRLSDPSKNARISAARDWSRNYEDIKGEGRLEELTEKISVLLSDDLKKIEPLAKEMGLEPGNKVRFEKLDKKREVVVYLGLVDVSSKGKPLGPFLRRILVNHSENLLKMTAEK